VRSDLTFLMVGSGGDGIVTMGDLLARWAARDGIFAVQTEAYGPQIRGGETSCTVRISSDEIFAQGDAADVLVVFGWADFRRFQGEISVASDAVVLYEAGGPAPTGDDTAGTGVGPETRFIPVPFEALAKESAGRAGAKNVVTLGVLAELFGFPTDMIRAAIDERFTRKKPALAEANGRAYEAGIAWARSLGDDPAVAAVTDKRFRYERKEPRLLLSGNEASALGALHAGCRFFAGYPITPSSEILHFMAENLPRIGGSVVQTEDELSAIGCVIGASFAGVKSMTATSGPGLSLMIEMLGLAAMAEVPAVIVDVQRGGPSTGNPTRSEQSDLLQSLFGTHGDAPRVVLACADVEDCFHATAEAFNIAEEFQLPVLVLSDQAVGQRKETLSPETLVHEVRGRTLPGKDDLVKYERYRDTPTGVSPMAIPGMRGGAYQTNGLEHDESGRPSSQYLAHEKMNAKRYRKMWSIRDRYRFHRRYGPPKADLGIVCWGSSKGPVQAAVRQINENANGLRVAAFVPQMIYPFPKADFERFLEDVDTLLVVELSYTAQFYKYLRTFLDLPAGTHVFKRSGGKELTVAEVMSAIDAALCGASTVPASPVEVEA
jgi:2-oxoglutarate ferredoxin oxidoreductase subunit alpha